MKPSGRNKEDDGSVRYVVPYGERITEVVVMPASAEGCESSPFEAKCPICDDMFGLQWRLQGSTLRNQPRCGSCRRLPPKAERMKQQQALSNRHIVDAFRLKSEVDRAVILRELLSMGLA